MSIDLKWVKLITTMKLTSLSLGFCNTSAFGNPFVSNGSLFIFLSNNCSTSATYSRNTSPDGNKSHIPKQSTTNITK